MYSEIDCCLLWADSDAENFLNCFEMYAIWCVLVGREMKTMLMFRVEKLVRNWTNCSPDICFSSKQLIL